MMERLWKLRHADVPCPVTETSFEYTEETMALWMDLGFFAEPSSYFTCVLRASDLISFAETRTQQWLGILDKLSATRKIAEKAKGAMIGKVDYDVVAVSVALTTKVADLLLSSTNLVPAQRIWWEDDGRTAVHAAGMEMARTVFTGYKTFDRKNTAQLMDDAMRPLLDALKSVPHSIENLHR